MTRTQLDTLRASHQHELTRIHTQHTRERQAQEKQHAHERQAHEQQHTHEQHAHQQQLHTLQSRYDADHATWIHAHDDVEGERDALQQTVDEMQAQHEHEMEEMRVTLDDMEQQHTRLLSDSQRVTKELTHLRTQHDTLRHDHDKCHIIITRHKHVHVTLEASIERLNAHLDERNEMMRGMEKRVEEEKTQHGMEGACIVCWKRHVSANDCVCYHVAHRVWFSCV